MDSLPPEMVDMIASNLSGEDLGALRLTSKRYAQDCLEQLSERVSDHSQGFFIELPDPAEAGIRYRCGPTHDKTSHGTVLYHIC